MKINLSSVLSPLRCCVLGISLIMPMTGPAAADSEPRAQDLAVAVTPDAAEPRVPTAAPKKRQGLQSNRCSTDVEYTSTGDTTCEEECGRVYDSCKASCDGSKWCILMCALNHTACVFSCNASGP